MQTKSLQIYDTGTFHIVQSIALEADFASKAKTLRFGGTRASSTRLILASDTTIHIYDTVDQTYHVTVQAAAHPTGRISLLGSISRDEVLVFPDFSVKATIWNLSSGQGVEVRDPKSRRGASCYSLRPQSNHLALLTRTAAGKDHVLVLGPATRAIEASFQLDTQDAHGIRWSPDGRWLVAWEAPNLGLGVWVYTADGQLFRQWTRAADKDVDMMMGARICEWDASSSWLLVGSSTGEIVGLRARTVRFPTFSLCLHRDSDNTDACIDQFTPHFTLSHSTPISLPEHVKIYQEQISAAQPATGARDYAEAQQPAIPPSAGPSNPNSSSNVGAGAQLSSSAPPSSGITHLCPAPNSPYLASVCAATPTTVWIHHLPSSPDAALSTACVLIHHNPVKTLQWHPSAEPPYLLIHCHPPPSPSGSAGSKADQYWAHIWSSGLAAPLALPIALPQLHAHAPASSSSASGTMSLTPVDTPVRASLAWLGSRSTTFSGGENDASPLPTASLLQLCLSTSAGVTVENISAHDTSQFALPTITGNGPEDAFDEIATGDQSLDSVDAFDAQPGDHAVVDDTFAFKRGWSARAP